MFYYLDDEIVEKNLRIEEGYIRWKEAISGKMSEVEVEFEEKEDVKYHYSSTVDMLFSETEKDLLCIKLYSSALEEIKENIKTELVMKEKGYQGWEYCFDGGQRILRPLTLLTMAIGAVRTFDLVKKCRDDILRKQDPPEPSTVNSVGELPNYYREMPSDFPSDLRDKVLAHFSPRDLISLIPLIDEDAHRPLINQAIWDEHLKKATKLEGFVASVRGDEGGGVGHKLDLYFDGQFNLMQLMEHQGYVKMLGSANGIVLLLKEYNFVVLNPITQIKRILPQPNFEFDPDSHEVHEFHYMESKKEYKVLRIVQHMEDSYSTEVEVYSSSTDSWKVIDVLLPCIKGEDGEISFEANPRFTLPVYHAKYPVKIGDQFFYDVVDPRHSYHLGIIGFDMKDYSFKVVKNFPRKVYPISYDVQLGVRRDSVLALLVTNVDTNEQCLTTFDGGSSAEAWCTKISLLPKLLVERLEEMGVVVDQVLPFTDSLHAVTLKIPF